MIKSFEEVYKGLEELFINKLPDYIEKINQEYNDGIILKPFENTKLEKECIKLPCFKFKVEETEYSEKDRIIENTNYKVSLEINQKSDIENQTIIFWRYIKAINLTLKVSEYWQECKITNIFKNKIIMRITV